jgi:hypothetical protein
VALADGATLAAGVVFAGDCCAANKTDVHRRNPSKVLRIGRTLERFTLADVDVMFALL